MIVDGNKLGEEIKEHVKKEVAQFSKCGETINFTVVIVGQYPASVIYVERKGKACAEVGINFNKIELDKNVTQQKLNATLLGLSNDSNVHGIMLQLPLPKELKSREAINYIAPQKDVDGLTAENFGRLTVDEAVLAPCTARGILHILKSSGVKLAGADACVIGRSNIVGKPAALMLTGENATVTLCHKQTKDLLKYTKNADIIVAAAGSIGLVKGEMVKNGAAVVDVGINKLPSGKIVGDVEFASVAKRAGVISPVPGGVGPLTIAFLLDNIVKSYKLQKGGI